MLFIYLKQFLKCFLLELQHIGEQKHVINCNLWPFPTPALIAIGRDERRSFAVKTGIETIVMYREAIYLIMLHIHKLLY